ncbi:hypothetical protein [Vibrio furnissii]|uniref:hypothetical protein n=1 Tax=Vibrio furnissii TaxID=29494 RepID=UPI0001B93326|nr:hypothetical protein [Vibrio furnissii]EEX39697.1 hypothetical protein VFA_002231 [Vibrio furnissii CIP 102972]MCG6211133.1 hypothetical protein [Vibrio furnissii]QDC94441.1 hypothetical protein FIU11_17015 [Vibrio furnissii]UON49883.1 hypothetical protein IUJ52_20265 [Vibrio furnissii]SUQ33596.1 Uncharacterised protein [Vibrio furnissii]
MDTSSVIIDYSAEDFAQAIRALLPKGQYWQEVDNPELTSLIEAMATDFKATHDDIELSLLTDFQEALFGWKISDYQALLYTQAGDDAGTVSDDRTTPNLIYVALQEDARISCAQAWAAFEEKRLPHTEITWTYQSRLDVHHQLANCRHIRNQHNYEVTQ